MGVLKFVLPLKKYDRISSIHGMRGDPMQFKRPKITQRLMSTYDPQNYISYNNKPVSPLYELVLNPIKKFHSGIDYAVKIKTEVQASESGVVIRADKKEHGAFGLAIIIDHTPNADNDKKHFHSTYMHLSKYVATLGQRVEQGQLIAYSGDTGGRSTGPHLHFSIVKSPGALGWNPTGNSGVTPTPKLFLDPKGFYGKTIKVYGTLYDLSDKDIAILTESADVKMCLDLKNNSWYGDLYLGNNKVGRISKDHLEFTARLSRKEFDEIIRDYYLKKKGPIRLPEIH